MAAELGKYFQLFYYMADNCHLRCDGRDQLFFTVISTKWIRIYRFMFEKIQETDVAKETQFL